jgi:hypothetical protein
MMPRRKNNKLGDLIVFDDIKDSDGWLDEFENLIPPGTLGMIIDKEYKRLPEFVGWEYDILIPSLGIVSPHWGNFAFKDLD